MKITNEIHNTPQTAFERNPFRVRGVMSGARDLFTKKSYTSDFEIQHYLNRIFRFKVLDNNEVITRKALKNGYSQEGAEFMEAFFKDYYMNKNASSLPDINSLNLIEMYRSTNEGNVKTRISLLKMFKKSPIKNKDGYNIVQSEIAQMYKLFDIIDNDKYAKQFIEKSIESHIPFETFSEINAMIEYFGSKKLNIFFDNFTSIMTKSYRKERFTALEQGLTNPFFETIKMRDTKLKSESYKNLQDESFMSKTFKRIQNFYNKLKFKHSKDIEYKPINVEYDYICR